MNDYEQTRHFVLRPDDGSAVPIPGRFFDGEWSVTAVAVYFHIITADFGISFAQLCRRHPRIQKDEISNALYALTTAGLIDSNDDEQPGIPGYVATGIVHDHSFFGFTLPEVTE